MLWYVALEIITDGLAVVKPKPKRDPQAPKLEPGEEEEVPIPVRSFFVGFVRPDLDSNTFHGNRDAHEPKGWFMSCATGSIMGGAADGHDFIREGKTDGFFKGDRVGMLLDLKRGSLRFFKNGEKHGEGFPAGSITGPVLLAAQIMYSGDGVRLIPDPPWPKGWEKKQPQ